MNLNMKEINGNKKRRWKKAVTKRSLLQKWRRIMFVCKGLSLAEYKERTEKGSEMREMSRNRILENFIQFQYKHTYTYLLLERFWSNSMAGQIVRDWRKEDDRITWENNSHTIWHKHIRLMNDINYLNKNANIKKRPLKTKFTYPDSYLTTPLGPIRLHLKSQLFSNTERHERRKKTSDYYPDQYPEVEEDWHMSSNYYLNFIKPWLGRLSYLDKNSKRFPYLGKMPWIKNYKKKGRRTVFSKELYRIEHNMRKWYWKFKAEKRKKSLPLTSEERQALKQKLKTYINYVKLLMLRRNTLNFAKIYGKVASIPNFKRNLKLPYLNPEYLDKNIYNYSFNYLNNIIQKENAASNSYMMIPWIFKPALGLDIKQLGISLKSLFFNWKKRFFD